MLKSKKMLLTLSSITAIATPAIAVVSCGSDKYAPRKATIDIEDIVSDLKSSSNIFNNLEVSNQLIAEKDEKNKTVSYTFNITKGGDWVFSEDNFNINKKINSGPFVVAYDWSKANPTKSDIVSYKYTTARGTWNVKMLERDKEGKSTAGYDYFKGLASSLAYRTMAIDSKNKVHKSIILNRFRTEREIVAITNNNDVSKEANLVSAYTEFMNSMKTILNTDVNAILAIVNELRDSAIKLLDQSLSADQKAQIQARMKTLNDTLEAEDESSSKNEFAKSIIRMFTVGWHVFDDNSFNRLKAEINAINSPHSLADIDSIQSTIKSYFAMPKMVEPVYRLLLASSLLTLHGDISANPLKNLSVNFVKRYISRLGYAENQEFFGEHTHQFDSSINGLQYVEADGDTQATTKGNNMVILKIARLFATPIW